jgi:MFS family permease
MAIGLLCIWGLASAAAQPVRQAYLNGLIPSKQRASILSFDALLGSSGGVVVQPVLGRVADVNGYASSFMVGGVLQVIALPLIWLAKGQKVESDTLKS